MQERHVITTRIIHVEHRLTANTPQKAAPTNEIKSKAIFGKEIELFT